MIPPPKKEIKSPFSSGNSNLKPINYQNYSLNQDENISTREKYSQYNSSSIFIKPTYTTIPKSSYFKKQIKIPFGINLTPLNNSSEENPIPVIDYGNSYDIPRCKNPKCGAYLNPFVEFINNGDQWECNICKNINKTMEYYYNSVEEQKLKPELNMGTYDFINYKDSWNKERPPIFTCYYFLIDISQSAMSTGFAQCVLESLKEAIINDFFYNSENENENNDISLCIITYDEQINFYPIDIKFDNKNNINVLTINESYKDLFLPINKEYLLVNLKKYKNKFIQIIENIQSYITNENYIPPKEATRFFDAIKICDLIGDKKGGKILIFNGSNLSKLDLMNKNTSENNDTNDYNDSKSRKYKNSDGGKIGKFGISISLHGLSVNIFLASKTYTNTRTLNQLIINSNGNFFFYKNFSSEMHYKSIFNQIRKVLQNQNIFECGLKFKFSHKFSIKDYITPVLIYNKNMVFFPNLDSDQSFSFILEMNYENNYESSDNYTINDDYTYMQACLSYNNGHGKKLIRVFNYCFPVSNNAYDIYNSINPENIGIISMQRVIMNLYRNKNIVECVNKFEKKFFEINMYYFNNLNMIKKELSEEMKLYALYTLGVLKNCLFNKNDKGINNDDDLTNFFLCKMQKLKIDELSCFAYPRIYALNDVLNNNNNENNFPSIINDNMESLINNGNIFLIDNGFYLILYIRNDIDKNIIWNLFEVNELKDINLENINESNIFDYSENKNEIKNKIIEIIDTIRNSKALFQNLKFVFEGINDQKGKIINENLIEDNYNSQYPLTYEKFFNKILFE